MIIHPDCYVRMTTIVIHSALSIYSVLKTVPVTSLHDLLDIFFFV